MFRINKDFTNATIPRTIRFTESIFEELNAVADREKVSFNMLVLQCCRYALKELETDEPKK